MKNDVEPGDTVVIDPLAFPGRADLYIAPAAVVNIEVKPLLLATCIIRIQPELPRLGHCRQCRSLYGYGTRFCRHDRNGRSRQTDEKRGQRMVNSFFYS